MKRVTKALVRQVSDSFPRALRRGPATTSSIDLVKARQQHQIYTETLQQCGVTVHTMEADDRYPDSIFIEDTSIVIQNKALLTYMGHPLRQGEVPAVEEALHRIAPQISTHRMNTDGSEGHIDGGDVLYTGKDLLVGLTQRTDMRGALTLHRYFSPLVSVIIIDLKRYAKEILHLKSAVSWCDTDVLALSDTPAGRRILSKLPSNYYPLWIPQKESLAANLLNVNGTILHPPKEKAPKTVELLKQLHKPLVSVDLSEFAKAGGALTCGSVLLE